MNIEIVQLKTKNAMKNFLKLPWKIYKGNPNWVPPLLCELKKTLDPRKNPFWEHTWRKIFLALRGDEPIGRITAIIDDNHNNL